MAANYRKRAAGLVLAGALALGVTGAAVAATDSVDTGANGLRTVQTQANGLKANGLRANGL